MSNKNCDRGRRKLANSKKLVYTPTLPSGKSIILSSGPGSSGCSASGMPYSEVNSSRLLPDSLIIIVRYRRGQGGRHLARGQGRIPLNAIPSPWTLSKTGTNVFWVDEREFPTVVDWRTSAPKDGMPAENTYSAEAVRTLDTHHMDLFSLIRAPNPTKVKTGSRPRATHEVPLLTVTANRVIEMEDPAAATDSSEVLPSEDVPATRGTPEAGQAKEVTATDPFAVTKSRKKGHDGADANAPPRVLRRDHADPRPTWSTREVKFLAAIELGMASTRPVPVPKSSPADVSVPDPLSFADPQSRHPADVAQVLLRQGIRSLRMPPLFLSTS
nr:hypothetical protein [Tanacetum cinerariifolium]